MDSNSNEDHPAPLNYTRLKLPLQNTNMTLFYIIIGTLIALSIAIWAAIFWYQSQNL